MKNFMHRLARFVLLVLVLFLSLGLMGAASSAERWQAVIMWGEGMRWPALMWGGVLFLLAWLFALSGLSPRKKTSFLTFETENGPLSISTQAICEYLAKLNQEFPSIIRMTTAVIPVRRSIDIAVDIRIKAGPQLHEVCEALQRRVRESMANGLGIQDVRKIRVAVREISTEHGGL